MSLTFANADKQCYVERDAAKIKKINLIQNNTETSFIPVKITR